MGVNIILFSLKFPPSFWMYSTDVHRAFYDEFFPLHTLQQASGHIVVLLFFQVTSKCLAGFQLVFSLMRWVLQTWSVKAQE